MCLGRAGVRCSQLVAATVPEATTTLSGGCAPTCCTRGAATLRERSYFDSKAPKAPAMPQQPVSSRVAVRPGKREASGGLYLRQIVNLDETDAGGVIYPAHDGGVIARRGANARGPIPTRSEAGESWLRSPPAGCSHQDASSSYRWRRWCLRFHRAVPESDRAGRR